MSEEEILKANGKIESCAIATRPDGTQITGIKKNGEPYTMYKYKIGGRYYSGFKDVGEYSLKRGDYCIVAYKEEPNKDPKKKPYKNIVNLTQAVAPDEMKEEDNKVNLTPIDVGKPTEQPKAITEEEKWDKINKKKQHNIMLGRAINNTIRWIIAERKLTKDHQTNVDYTLDEHFDEVLEHLWNKETTARGKFLKR